MAPDPENNLAVALAPALSSGPTLEAPERLERSVGTVLRIAAARHPERGLVAIDGFGRETTLTYPALLAQAERIVGGLYALGLAPGDRVLIQSARVDSFLALLWGCFLGGIAALPVPAVTVLDEQSAPMVKLRGIWEAHGRPPIAADAALADSLAVHGRNTGWTGLRLVAIEQLAQAAPPAVLPEIPPDTLAMLPLTSGSTGLPKAVRLTHRNILGMSAGTLQANRFGTADVALNWMPLDHPGAAVFMGVVPAEAGATQIHVPTNYVLTDPLRWLELIDRHRASISWAPNFAFALINSRLAAAGRRFDLSSMRFLVSAGEQVAASTVRAFLEGMEEQGLAPGALRPAFGMAETCSGITWSRGLTRAALEGNPAHISLGPPIPGASIRITDDDDRVLNEGEIGALQLHGPSVLGGYLDNPAANAEAMRPGGWFRTGDLAFLRDGEMYITGRSSQNVIVNGLKTPAHDIEAAAEQVEGVLPSYAAVFSVWNEARGAEDLVVVFSPAQDAPAAVAEIARRLRGHLTRQTGIAPNHLVPLPPHEIPKSSIGKILRAALKRRFEAGEIVALKPGTAPLPAAASAQTAATSSAEGVILAAWQRVLGREAIAPDDNFFELGGHSVLLIQLHAELKSHFPSLDVVDLFRCPTVRSLAGFVAGAPATGGAAAATPHPAGDERHDIAVIGIACRFPGADSVAEFWDNLRQGKESVTRFTVEQLVAAGFDRAQVSHPDYVPASPVLNDAKGFDAGLFGYSAREAELLDPQQRLFLHCAWEALEDAGYDAARYPGRIGAYVGASMNTYFVNNVLPNRHRLDARDGMDVFTLDSMGGFQAMVANDKDYVATRASYKLDLRGPSVNVQTACSTGLVAIHLAVQSLRAGECEMALAGTAAVQSPQAAGHLWQDGMIVSADGHCRAFDAQASGTIFGSGVAAVLLKPLARAQADGDHVYAVIRGTAVNNDGGLKVGYMAPSGTGETAVVRDALADAGVDPESITLLEAHGTATRLGDQIEVASLTAALGRRGDRAPWCALGSVKTNVGHLQISSGMAGFLKALLALQHGVIPPTLHFTRVNPALDLEHSPFHVNTEPLPWTPPAGVPRRAGVNSLGIGGTNAHVILEEAPDTAPVPPGPDRGWHVLTLSAGGPAALSALTASYKRFLAAAGGIAPGDLAFTANTGRRLFAPRRAILFDSLATLRARLGDSASWIDGTAGAHPPRARLALGPDTTIGPGYGVDLFLTAPAFRDALTEADTATPSIVGALYGGDGWPEDAAFAAAARAAITSALARLLRSWGIEPAADSDPAEGCVTLPGRPGADGALWPGLLEGLARLHVGGAAVDWAALDRFAPRRRVPLPTYPFESRPYWLEAPRAAQRTPAAGRATHPLIDRTFTSPLVAERFVEADLDPARHPLLRDHLIQDRIVVSGSCLVSLLTGAKAVLPGLAADNGLEVRDVAFLSALELPEGGKRAQIVLTPGEDRTADFKVVTTRADGEATVHATGRIAPADPAPSSPLDFAACAARCPLPVDLDEHHRLLADRRIALGPLYRWITELRRGQGEALGRLAPPKEVDPGEAAAFGVHPGLLDCCFGMMVAATAGQVEAEETFIPTGIDRVRMLRRASGSAFLAWGRFEVSPDRHGARGDVVLAAADGTPLLEVTGLVGRSARWEQVGQAAARPKTATDAVSGLYRIDWLEAAPAVAGEAPATRWLVVGDQDGLGEALAAGLRRHGQDCRRVEPDGIEAALEPSNDSRRPALIVLGGDVLVALPAAQALARHENSVPGRQPALWLVTRAAQSVDPGEPADPGAAMVWGLGKVIRLEHPALDCHVVDCDAHDTNTSAIAERLVAELMQAPAEAPPELAMRGSRRLTPRLVPLPPAATARPDLDPDAAYLLTGASGALGGSLLGWLADRGARTIVTVSRSGQIDPTLAARLAADGLTVHRLSVDVGDADALQAAWKTLPAGLPRLRGIVHAAGVLDDATLARTRPEQMAAVARPKVDGAMALARLVPPEGVDFLVLFSSAASVLGNAGQAAYAAANSGLDAVAAGLRARGVRATAVGWGPWSGGGMAERSHQVSAGFARLGLRALDPTDALRRLDAALAADRAHVCAIDADWPLYVERTRQAEGTRRAFFAALLPGETAARAAAPSLKAALEAARAGDRRQLLFDFVARQVTEALSFTGVAAIDPAQPLMDQGLDSLAVVGVRSALNTALERTWPVGMLFEHPTLNGLVDYLLATLFPHDGPVAVDEEEAALDALDLAALDAMVRRELDS